jgi:hypothetical protein
MAGVTLWLVSCGGGSNNGGGAPPIVGITISPTSAFVAVNGTQQFTVTVTGTSNTAVTWTATAGTISVSGLYTAPASVPTPNPVTVTVTSVADSTKSASAQVTILAPPPPINKQTVSVTAGQTTSNVNIAVAPLTPTLQLVAVGIGTTAGSTAVTVPRGSAANLFIVGKGIVPGTFYQVSGPNDVQVTQPVPSDFCTATGGIPCVNVNISVNTGAALGPRDLLVENGSSEISVFPGGIIITQGP